MPEPIDKYRWFCYSAEQGYLRRCGDASILYEMQEKGGD
jgi:hypothetical protein